MIRASEALSAAKAMDYFRQDYTRGDYYAAERRGQVGVWQGRGAERLGLTGRPAGIRLEEFEVLLAGRSPLDGRQLVAPEAGTGKHRAAWDLVVSPDKSVSLVALLMPDPRVERAHIAAAGRAFEMLEQQALTKDRDRQLVATGNLVIARFDHDSSRALDPQLHSHHVIFNLTDRAGCAPGAAPAKSAARGAGAEWRALETSGLFAAQRLATAIYHAELARSLQALGYEVRANAKGHVGIPGFPKGALAAFSKRRKQILDELDRERDAGGAADPQSAALRTRQAKIHDVDPEVLRARWRAEADGLGIDFAGLRQAADARLARGASGGQPAAGDQQARVSVAWAVAHLGERQAAFRVMDLENTALRHGAARGPGLDEIRAAVAGQPGSDRPRRVSGGDRRAAVCPPGHHRRRAPPGAAQPGPGARRELAERPADPRPALRRRGRQLGARPAERGPAHPGEPGVGAGGGRQARHRQDVRAHRGARGGGSGGVVGRSVRRHHRRRGTAAGRGARGFDAQETGGQQPGEERRQEAAGGGPASGGRDRSAGK